MTNSLEEGDNDMIQVTSKPFTRSKAWELQELQGILMKRDILKHTLILSKGFHALMIEFDTESRPIGNDIIAQLSIECTTLLHNTNIEWTTPQKDA